MLDFFWELLNKGISGWYDPFKYIIWIICLAIGVFFLVKFCDMFVESSSAIAKKLKISPLIIGLTVVAIGTSCPELAVSVSNSINALKSGGTADIAIGNVVGSNICNIALVLGLSAIFTPIVVKKTMCKREFPFLLFIMILLTVFGCFFAFTNTSGVSYPFGITRIEGIILCVFIFVYIGFLIYHAKKHPDEDQEVEEIEDMNLVKAIIFVIIGAVGIIAGGEAVVYGAQNVAVKTATLCGVDEAMAVSLVGLTIVAVGTSLPELVTSVIAAKKGENELALGNVIGSNIFNTVFVLGIASVINPLGTLNPQMWVEILVMLALTVILFAFSLKGKITKKNGYVFIGIYALFLIYLIIRTVI